jgi:hypothetical protein
VDLDFRLCRGIAYYYIIPSPPLLSPLSTPCGDQYATSFGNHPSSLYPARSDILEADLQQPRPTVSQCNNSVPTNQYKEHNGHKHPASDREEKCKL